MTRKKIVLFVVLVPLIIIVLALFLLPFILPSVIEKNSKDWIGRSVHLDKMRVNYFTGTIRLYDFDLYEKDDSTVFVGFDTLLVDTEPYRLFSNTFVIEQFYLQGLFVDVIMYDSAFNFDDLLALGSDSTSSEEKPPPDENEPLKFEISNMELSSANFIIQDAEIQDSVEIKNFHFFLPLLVWDQENKSEADVEFQFKNEGYFESAMFYDPDDGNFEVEFTIGNYDISGYPDFVAKYKDVGKFEGIIDLDVKLEGNVQRPMESLISSNFQLSNFALYDDKEQVMLGTEKFQFKLDKADIHKREVLIDSIYLDGPSLYFEAYDSTSNIAEYVKRIMPPQDTLRDGNDIGSEEEMNIEITSNEVPDSTGNAEVRPEQKDTTQQFFVSINTFLLENGMVEMADYTHDRTFEYQISNITVSSDSITSLSDILDLDVRMDLSDRGKMESDILVNLKDPGEMQVDFTISNLMLEDFDVYCREGTGYPLIYGDMYFKSQTRIINDSIKSENNLVIHNMKLGRRGNPIGPPLKFGMFLLKDKDKVVHIDLPVDGPMGESAADIGKLFWDTFSQLMVKVVATPFKFIGAAVNVFDADIQRIKYDYMDSTFTDKMERQLSALLKLEEKDEELKIDLIYYKDSLLERQEIAMNLIGEEFGGRRGRRNFETDKDRFRKYVERRIKTDTLSIEDACLMLADQDLVNSISAAYDSARFRSLRNYLYSQRDTTSIMLYYSRDVAPNNEDRAPRFEVKLGMKDDFIEEKYIDDKKDKESLEGKESE